MSKHKDDWDQWLNPVVYAYNSSHQESTGLSPYQIVFGRMPQMPVESELDLSFSSPATLSEYSQAVQQTLRDVRQIAHDNLTQVRASQMERSREGTKGWQPYAVGQSVWLRRSETWEVRSEVDRTIYYPSSNRPS